VNQVFAETSSMELKRLVLDGWLQARYIGIPGKKGLDILLLFHLDLKSEKNGIF